eukprot:Lankesteria_metandrocarpae@DN3039_c0_g1_i1.p1
MNRSMNFLCPFVFLFLCLSFVPTVKGQATCDPASVCTGQGYTELCDSGDDTICLCDIGYTSSSTAAPNTCLEGIPCTSGSCADGTLHDGTQGLCLADGTNVCVCAADHDNDSGDGTCVAACGGNCRGTGEIGCITGGTPTCACDTDYVVVGGSPLECVPDCSKCNASTVGIEGTCTAPGGTLTCDCSAGYKHDADPLVCVDICTGVTCDGGIIDDGTCVSPKGCGCLAGYVNIADGTCVEGAVCTGAPPTVCDDLVVHAGDALCTAHDTTWCKCAAGHDNDSSDGTCVATCSGNCQGTGEIGC